MWREFNDGHPTRYPVLLWLSRPLDDLERYAVRTTAQMVPGKDPRMLLIDNTTLEEVRDQLGALNGKIDSAATLAASLGPRREAAQAEDDRLLALEAEINESLGNPND